MKPYSHEWLDADRDLSIAWVELEGPTGDIGRIVDRVLALPVIGYLADAAEVEEAWKGIVGPGDWSFEPKEREGEDEIEHPVTFLAAQSCNGIRAMCRPNTENYGGDARFRVVFCGSLMAAGRLMAAVAKMKTVRLVMLETCSAEAV